MPQGLWEVVWSVGGHVVFLSFMLLWLCGPWDGAPVPPFPVSFTYHPVSHIGPYWVELKCLRVGRLVKIVNQDRRKQNIFRNKGNWNPVTEPSVWDELGQSVSCTGATATWSLVTNDREVDSHLDTLFGLTLSGVLVVLLSCYLQVVYGSSGFQLTSLMGSFSDLPSLEEMPLLQIPEAFPISLSCI